MDTLPDGRMRLDSAAQYLGVAENTLRKWLLEDGKGPRSVKLGRLRFFFKADLDAFIQANASDSEAA